MRRLDYRPWPRRRRRGRTKLRPPAHRRCRESRAVIHGPLSARAASRLGLLRASPRSSLRYELPNEDEPLLRAAGRARSPRASNGAGGAPAPLEGLRSRCNYSIAIHGAREHNLKNLSLSIPRDQLVVITGLSGSGKSTVAVRHPFSEGQRRFLDSMSPYARQFVEQLEKPDVDLIEGLPPSGCD